MEINRKNALRFWETVYGSELLVSDCFGTLIYKEDYGDYTTERLYEGKKYNFGWTIDHILPIKLGGTDDNNNLEIMHWKNNQEKGDHNTFVINNIRYAIYRCKQTVDGYRGYGIINQNTGLRIDWKATQHKYF